MSKVKLNSGYEMPVVGLGTWRIPEDKAEESVYNAIKLGYRHIDCAYCYENEKEVGLGIKKAIDEGIVKRSDLFITSKLWNNHHAPEHVPQAIKYSLKCLGLTYLDLYLVHFPVAFKFNGVGDDDKGSIKENGKILLANVPLQKTWEAMEKLVKDGLTRSIGVSNYGVCQILDVLSYCKIKPAVNQFELHPFFTRKGLVNECLSNGIHVVAYGSLGSGEDDSPLKEKVVVEIAKKHKKTEAQVLLKWAVQIGVLVIPKSNSLNRIKENIDLFSFKLTDDEVKSISALNKNLRYVDPQEFFGFDIWA